MDILNKNSSRNTITMGMWTTSNQKKVFMAIMAHFFDDNWDLQSWVMRFFTILY